MSDSIKKYWELVEEGKIDPFKSIGDNVTELDLTGKQPEIRFINTMIVSEGHKKEAYSILVEHSEEAITEAYRILQSGK